ncbi:uncharacterized protein IUM83_02634 [Phytophthora cinnamomi]|uniref:uncharacterized protein n=1 Tax=Phytophthora cinnamomi TaxID=4785 RepID=UPI0035597FAF|nr:hypothetical protein IUM83_02634 [Phytophthora cinnamomi]
MKTRQIIFTALLAGTISVAVCFAITAATVFPMPFGLLLVGLPSSAVIFACAVYFWGDQWRSDAAIRSDIKRILDVAQCQTVLTSWVRIGPAAFLEITMT